MEVLVMGLALAFNVLVIIWKLRNERVKDGILDLGLLLALMWLTVGTLTGMLVGTIASFVVSVYLLISPVGVKREKSSWKQKLRHTISSINETRKFVLQ